MGAAEIGTRKQWFYVRDLVLDERRFQDRNPNAAGYGQAYKQKGRSEAHIRSLIEAIENTGEPLDPLTVWKDPDEDRLYVVDGFHRHKAYSRAIERKTWSKKKKVPCYVATGDEDAVVLKVFQDNQKGKMGFSKQQRLQAAWEKLLGGALRDMSNANAAKAANVSKGSIYNMRQAIQGYEERSMPPPELWEMARKYVEEPQDDYTEAREMEERQKEAAQRLSAIFEDYGWSKEVLGKALEMVTDYHPRLEATLYDRKADEESDF